VLAQLNLQPCLPETGLAHDRNDLPAALVKLRHGLLQPGLLRAATDEGRR
jgi:hypothetical protein